MSTLEPATLRTDKLHLRAAARLLVENLDFVLNAGEIVAILGVNGAGKTTLLEALCAARPVDAGSIMLNEMSVDSLAARERARLVGLMPQKLEDGFDHPVVQRVALGCYARGGVWQWQHNDDYRCSVDALERVGLAGFDSRSTATLSGGERQRMGLAMLLAQRPTLMLLDEPFSQLDPVHQSQCMDVLREARAAGHGIAITLHDVNAAVRLADRVLLLFGDGRWAMDAAPDILTAPRLSELYGTPVRALDDGRFFSIYG